MWYFIIGLAVPATILVIALLVFNKLRFQQIKEQTIEKLRDLKLAKLGNIQLNTGALNVNRNISRLKDRVSEFRNRKDL